MGLTSTRQHKDTAPLPSETYRPIRNPVNRLN